MAEIFVPPDNPENYLQATYQRAFWQALVEYAPSVLAYLRTHGVEAWLERYGLPREPWYQVGLDYLEDPHTVVLRNFWYSDAPPALPRLEDFLQGLPHYDPSTTPGAWWRARASERLEAYMTAVERAYAKAGWQRVRVKTNPEHFAWLALRLEGCSYEEIATRLELVVGDDTVRKGVQAVAELLGIRLPHTPKGGGNQEAS